MNPRSFPKRLESKTSSLRINVPDNLDLALEGLIRNVLREQPKTEDIYSFAANYFETLLSIRDKTGLKFTATQLCPFHNDEEAQEMILLAGRLAKKVPERPRQKGEVPAPLKTKSSVGKRDVQKSVPEKDLKRSEGTLKGAKPDVEKKQATPDLIKKMPLSAQDQVGGEKVGEAGAQGAPDGGRDHESSEMEPSELTSEPIKEFVQKELLTDANAKEGQDGENAPEPSEKPIASEPQKVGADIGAGPSGDGENDADAEEKVGGAEASDGPTKIDSSTRETDRKQAKDDSEDAECKTGKATHPESEGGRHLKEEKEDEGEASEFRTEEGFQDKIESGTTGLETGAEGVETPPPDGTVKGAQEHVQGVLPKAVEDLEDGRRATGVEVTSPPEKENCVIGETAEVKSQSDAQPSVAADIKTDEETPKTSSFETKSAENDDARPEESDKVDEWKEMHEKKSNNSGENGEDKDLAAEGFSKGPEKDINNSDAASLPDRAEIVREKKENGTTFHQEKNEISNKEGEKQDTRVDDPTTADGKSAEERKELTAAVEAQENAAESPEMKLENSTREPDTSDDLEYSGTKASTRLCRVQALGESARPVPAAETERSAEDGKATDEKLPDEDINADVENLADDRESPSGPRSSEETSGAGEIQPGVEALTRKATTLEGDRTPPNEKVKSGEQGNANKHIPEEDKSSSGHGEMPDGARPKEFNMQDVTGVENESPVEEELCTVVDVSHIMKEGAPEECGRCPEEPEPAKLRPEQPLAEQLAAESEEAAARSIAPRERTNDNLTPMQTQTAESKTESDVAPQESAKPDIDKEGAAFNQGAAPQSGGTQEAEDKSQISSQGTHIVVVEEPEVANDKVEAEGAAPPGEIQIKTIQTHYYDALRVPETVTREYRVHGVAASPIDGLPSAAVPTSPNQNNEKRSREPAEEDAGAPPSKEVSPSSELAEADGPLESDNLEHSEHPPDAPASSPLTEDGLDRGAQISEPQNLPTSDFSSNLPEEVNLQKATGIFLIHEKRFSSLENKEIRFVAPGTDETADGPEKIIESSRNVAEVATEAPFTSTAETRPAQQRDETLEEARSSAEGTKGTEHDGENLAGSFEGSPEPSSGRTADDNPTETEKPISGTPSRGEDENAVGGPPQAEGTEREDQAEVLNQVALAVSGDTKAESKASVTKTLEEKVSESHQEGVQTRSQRDGRRGGGSPERTVTGEGSSRETDSPTSSTTTEIKTSDSARRDFASVRSLSTARSLDLGKRNPLLRTRSLSTHRRGVADFEVWNTIEKELEEAATKIQAKFRGYNTRKKLRREVAVQISTEESSRTSTPAEADDAGERCGRATGEFHDVIVLSEHPR